MQVSRIVKKDGKITKTSAEVKTPVYNVRIRQDIYERLAVRADKEDRKITNYINRILEKSLEQDIQ